ncbi:MAG: mevalonate kinase [Candidatus Aenigmarchaeota archaeon]|nr:mevalonate kinase [Candidatus Aenigmarchaeota archaeon]
MSAERSSKRLQEVKASAPGKVILFGEHSVVYNGLGIASSVDKRCFVTVNQNIKKNVLIYSKDLNLKRSFKENELFKFFDKIEELKKENKFDEIKKIGKKHKLNALFFVIASLMKKYGFKSLNILIETEVPKNLGSSSSLFSSIALAVSKFLGKNLSKKEISDFAYEGDIIAHGGTPSGIDNSIVTHGKYIQYKRSEGIKFLDINFKLPLIFVDSGEPSRTGDTVPYIRYQREENQKFVDQILERLNYISIQSLDALKEQNLELIGKLMLDYYSELKKLNISTERLDKIIDISVENKALGAKPTGGWGGGCCIVLARDQKHAEDLIKIYKNNGFHPFQAKIGVGGVEVI